MAANPVDVVPRVKAVQYDGTNSADIDALISDFTIVTEQGGVLSILSNGGQHAAPVDGWFIYDISGYVIDGVSNATFEQQKVIVPDAGVAAAAVSQVEELAEQLANLQVIDSAGAATFSALAGASSVDVPMTPELDGDDYLVHDPVLFSGVNIGNLSVTDTEIVQVNDVWLVRVSLNNSGILALGASVLVTVSAN